MLVLRWLSRASHRTAQPSHPIARAPRPSTAAVARCRIVAVGRRCQGGGDLAHILGFDDVDLGGVGAELQVDVRIDDVFL